MREVLQDLRKVKQKACEKEEENRKRMTEACNVGQLLCKVVDNLVQQEQKNTSCYTQTTRPFNDAEFHQVFNTRVERPRV